MRADRKIWLTCQVKYPIVVIDFEASALTLESFPIEVGVAQVEDVDCPVVSWSAIIAPAPTWDMQAQWDPDAQRVHGISPWQLRDGSDPAYVMRELNRRARDRGTVFCDGGHYDAHWLRTLATSAGIEPEFVLGDIAKLLIQYPAAKIAFDRALQGSAPPHRAGPDAHRLCSALAEAFDNLAE